MRLKNVYAAMAIVGTVLPLSQFLPWFGEYGLDVPRFLDALFVNAISRFFAFDLLVTAVVAIVLMLVEGRRSAVPMRWLPILGTLLVGVSCGLPLFLALREHSLRGSDAPASRQVT
jgi:hypothetical protein